MSITENQFLLLSTPLKLDFAVSFDYGVCFCFEPLVMLVKKDKNSEIFHGFKYIPKIGHSNEYTPVSLHLDLLSSHVKLV